MDQRADRPEQPAAGSAEKDGKQSEGISQFIGKVLDQLSLSSWLPAAMLVGCLAVLLQLRSQGNFDVGAAVVALTGKPLGILIVLLFALVLAAMVSQAFSFGAIRFLEGYWGGPLLALGVFTIMVRRKKRRLERLRARYDKQEAAAFSKAVEKMVRTVAPHIVVILLQEMQADEDETEPPYTWTEEQLADAHKLDWRAYSTAEYLTRLTRTSRQIEEHPDVHRLRPTKLGNVLRATEDSLPLDGGDMEGFIMRIRELIPSRLQQHHDQFRTRLDMYCTLVFIYAVLGMLSIVLFVTASMPLISIFIVTALFAAMTAASYYAAVSSARGYCTTLRVIVKTVNKGSSGGPTNGQS